MEADDMKGKAFNNIISDLLLRTSKCEYVINVNSYLNSSRKENANCHENLCVQPITSRLFDIKLITVEANRPTGSNICFFDWLQTVLTEKELDCHEIFQLLFINKINEDGWTSLHLSIFQFQRQFNYSELRKVEILLDSLIFDVNYLTNGQETVLHFACRCQKSKTFYCRELEEIIKNILNLKVRVNQRNSSGQTALMVACENECFTAVHALMTWNASNGYEIDLSVEDNRGETALSISKKLKNAKIVEMIENSSFLNAVENGDVKTVKIQFNLPNDEWKRQIEIAEKYNAPIDDHTTIPLRTDIELKFVPTTCLDFSIWLEAVWIANRKSLEDILKLLFNDDRYIQGFNEDGQTVLHLAVMEYLEDGWEPKRLQKIKILLTSCKFNVNALNLQKETVLHVACCISNQNSSYSDFFHVLLEILNKNGIDFNHKNIQGKTALMLACEYRHAWAVSTLLCFLRQCPFRHDLEVVDNSGSTALVIAKRKNFTEIVKIFEIREELVALVAGAKFIYAVTDENKDLFKISFDDIGHRDDSFMKSRNDFQFWNDMTKRGNVLPERIMKDFTWLEAVQRADERSYEDIINVLLDFDVLVHGQQGKNGDPILHRMLRFINKSEYLRSIEILLGSGKINVNAINCEARSALHSLIKTCHKSVQCDGKKHDDITCKTVTLLLRHGVDINLKDKEGKTSLAVASEIGCTCIVRGILNWVKKKGIWLDIDAKDGNGRTALMKTAMWKHVEAAKLLLKAGASVNLSDNRGFTTLHHALYEILSYEQWINFGDFPRNFEEMKNRNSVVPLFKTQEPNKSYKRNRDKLNEDKMNIVKLLLETEDVKLNAIDCEGYSPLDIAEALIPETPLAIKQILIQKRGALHAFQHKNQNSSNYSYSDSKYANILHRLFNKVKFHEDHRMAVNRSRLYENAKCNFSNLNATIQRQMTSTKDQWGRTALHWAVISLQNSINVDDDIETIEMLISFGCSVNEVDIYGRTPLHYANTRATYLHLIQIKVDEKIKDIYGKTATEKQCKFPRESASTIAIKIQQSIVRQPKMTTEKIKLLHADNKIHWCEHFNPKTIPARLWRDGGYAFRDPTVRRIKNNVIQFIEDVASEIKRRDSRFEVRCILVGSSNEGTKIDRPDEFDFNLVLTKFSELCEVFTSPELPTGFVRLKRKHLRKDDEKVDNFDSFFNENGILITEKLNTQFKLILKTVLADIQFIQSQEKFYWNLHSMSERIAPFEAKRNLATTVKITNARFYFDDIRRFGEISIDIVPCIHNDGWWPDEAISNVSDDIKDFGCNFVFDYPQRFYPWVPFSESCVRISFAPAESEMIKRSSNLAKQAYMIGKQLISKFKYGPTGVNPAYALKTCLLYCIEAFESTDVAGSELKLSECSLKSHFKRMDLRLWLGFLMKCHLDFIAQDFCPCYFMPSCCLPIRDYLKSSHMRCLTDDDSHFFENYQSIYMMYFNTSFQGLDFCVQHPAVNSIFEHFDRKIIISDLSKSAIENLATNMDDSNDSEYVYCGGWCETLFDYD